MYNSFRLIIIFAQLLKLREPTLAFEFQMQYNSFDELFHTFFVQLFKYINFRSSITVLSN